MNGLIPAPVRIDLLEGDGLVLGENLTIQADLELSALVEVFRAQLLTAIDLRSATPGASADLTLRLIVPDDDLAELRLGVGLNPRSPDDVADERYRLVVETGSIRLDAITEEGIFRGLTTLSQLIRQAIEFGGPDSASDDRKQGTLAAQRIVDGPRFGWRGLSLDVVRTFFNVDDVKSVIDLLATYKMNVLHLHLSDNEGWRLEVESWPELTNIGGRGARGDRPGGYYTQADYREIVRHAQERFVTVVPEIDVPGHTAAIFAAYPQLGGGERGNDAVPLSYLDPRRESSFTFLRNVLSEVAALTPGGYLHIGGDEAFGMPEDLYIQFVERALDIARRLGKRVVGWQEISRGAVQLGDVVQYWIGFDPDVVFSEKGFAASLGMPAESVAAMKAIFSHAKGDAERVRAKSASVILSPSSVAYLDTPYAEQGDAEQEADRQRVGLRAYQPLTVEESTGWDPVTVIADIDVSMVVGVEAAIWCETVEKIGDLQFLLLPRLAAFVEKCWSPTGSLEWSDYRGRLAAHAPLWRAAGWNYFRSSLVDWR